MAFKDFGDFADDLFVQVLRRTGTALALVGSLALLVGSYIVTPAPAEALTASQDAEMLSLINGERSSAGLAPLTEYWDIEDDAQAQTARQIAAGTIFHTEDLAGVTSGWQALGENVGVGPSMSRLHDAFMASPGHRANVLGNYNYIGLFADQDSVGQTYITIIFMRADPANLKPNPSGSSTADTGEILTMSPGSISDIGGTLFEADIEWLASQGIAFPCSNDRPNEYCPDAPLARDEMATMLARGLGLPPASQGYFGDENGSRHEDDINAVAAAGITFGCNPPANDRFCPDSTLTRQQMASFFVRALDLSSPGVDFFADDDASVHEDDINALAESGITLGCNPPTNDRYCGAAQLTRGQIAAFLHRALTN